MAILSKKEVNIKKFSNQSYLKFSSILTSINKFVEFLTKLVRNILRLMFYSNSEPESKFSNHQIAIIEAEALRTSTIFGQISR